ncbi:MAG: bifunctional folylpolyglutamate synthase/dihydrofolate synthase [Acidobacteria bacterium]|nr:bifunctional folylpolyglutamate synthase/dihydrofolate synthase [Acidobacteriota bacterium]
MTALQWLDSLQGSGIRPGLGRMRTLLRALGRPQHAYRSIIVAGTNGKGSTSATLASIFRANGRRVGLYTSPHLVDIRERWRIDGELIDQQLLADCIARLQRAAEKTKIEPTYFEAMTLLAFIAFAIANCDIAVLEVGMGGRLDATNVVRPIAAVITPIDFDHVEYLGNTLRKIAGEKAGVIHRGTIVTTSNDDPDVVDILRRRALKFDNRFIVVRDEHDTPLVGPFQRRNAALAVRTARELGVPEEAIERGVKETQWRGRLERIDLDGKQIWIDGGHNPHAARTIAPFLDATLPHPRALVFGVMQDKDIAAITRELFPLFDEIITTEPFPPRSANADELAHQADGIAVRDPKGALRRAMASDAKAIFVGGSLYLAGEAIAFFDAQRENAGQQHQ